MSIHNAENDRIKRRYIDRLKHAKGHSDQTIDRALASIDRFESYIGGRSFKAFHIQQAAGFKTRLLESTNPSTKKPLSKATVHGILSDNQRFFHWLAEQHGYRSRIRYGDSDYFNLSDRDVRIASASIPREGPSLAQIRQVLGGMPAVTPVEKRDRAIIAFTILTGARDAATASMKLKHINLSEGQIFQDAREVKTKFAKSFPTWFFPVGDDIRAIVEEWVGFLDAKMLFGPNDPLFPATEVVQAGGRKFKSNGLSRRHWSTANRIRHIFKQAFQAAGLPYFNPHSFRNTLVALGMDLCDGNIEAIKAWSQNLGHEKLLTTLTSYGNVAPKRQADILRGLIRRRQPGADVLEIARELVDAVQRRRE